MVKNCDFDMNIRIILLTAILLPNMVNATNWEYIIVDNYSSYPALAKFNNTYVLVYSKEVKEGENLFVKYSTDGLNWSKGERITRFSGIDYQPYLMVDRQKNCWLVFTRKPFEKEDYDIYLMSSKDCINWSEPVPFIQTHTNDWYPYIYQDSYGTYWLFLSRTVFNKKGEATSAIFYTKSKDGVRWSELKQVTKATGAVFPRMVELNGRYLLFFSAFTGSWENLSRINEHNIFLMYSDDGRNWSKAGRLSKLPLGKFALYLDVKKDEQGRVWVTYTSNENGNEEVYLFSSKDGVNWSPPERVTRNVEYIASLNEPFGFKCDQKALLIDGNRFIIAYSSDIYPEQAPLFVAIGSPESMDNTYLLANFSEDMSPSISVGTNHTATGDQKADHGRLFLVAGIVLIIIATAIYRRRFA